MTHTGAIDTINVLLDFDAVYFFSNHEFNFSNVIERKIRYPNTKIAKSKFKSDALKYKSTSVSFLQSQ